VTYVFTDAQWLTILKPDANGCAYAFDHIIAKKAGVSRQTVHAARERLKVGPRRASKKAFSVVRNIRFTTAEMNAIDAARAKVGLSQAEYIRQASAHPGALKLLQALSADDKDGE